MFVHACADLLWPNLFQPNFAHERSNKFDMTLKSVEGFRKGGGANLASFIECFFKNVYWHYARYIATLRIYVFTPLFFTCIIFLIYLYFITCLAGCVLSTASKVSEHTTLSTRCLKKRSLIFSDITRAGIVVFLYFFTARHHASAVHAMALFPSMSVSVCPSVCHKSVFYYNG